jgi:hypothetical protein
VDSRSSTGRQSWRTPARSLGSDLQIGRVDMLPQKAPNRPQAYGSVCAEKPRHENNSRAAEFRGARCPFTYNLEPNETSCYLFGLVFGFRRGRHTLETAQQIFFRHTVELSVAARVGLTGKCVVDHRRRCFGLRFVDFDMLL